MAYVGVIFIVLSLVQMSNDRVPHDAEIFRELLFTFVAIFGILYVGYSFPAFRSKEGTINYLMLPASILEKFVFELFIRIGLMLILLPLLYWITFHLEGYFFTLFTTEKFYPVGFESTFDFILPNDIQKSLFWFVSFIASLVMLGFILAFTGGAMFSKQPLVKTLFSLAIIIIGYSSVIYIALEKLGVAKYNINDSLWLTPTNTNSAFRLFACAAILAIVVMLFVAYRKLKEKEV
ncbi:hypothetical protein GCM10011506_14390 [Marivirga lumbricoides]|uniref:ABC transporter permease n=1 Tax=Marivirga lumbricoides TaxID=1046115 RepID=A0ABQ1LW34_9BACT|nr:hypothetical protein GCM10011506_14390 [Marivirga lumbricoides]